MKTNCSHTWKEEGTHHVCSKCGKKSLILTKVGENLYEGQRADGRKYTVRADRHRYFFPDEWTKFINEINDDKNKLFFESLLYTGGRAMEVLNLRVIDLDLERETVRFTVTKQRVAKRNSAAISKYRTFFISSSYVKRLKTYIRKNRLEPENYIFLNVNKIPRDYASLSNKDKKKYYNGHKTIYHRLMKRALKRAGIEDWKNFSLHNVRKTYGQWMRIFDLPLEELCYRMGHDTETFLTHYGSSLVFTPQDKIKIMNIFGQVK